MSLTSKSILVGFILVGTGVLLFIVGLVLCILGDNSSSKSGGAIMIVGCVIMAISVCLVLAGSFIVRKLCCRKCRKKKEEKEKAKKKKKKTKDGHSMLE